MKKTYETPSIEVVKFQYRDQVVVASGCIVTNQNSRETDNKNCWGVGNVETTKE